MPSKMIGSLFLGAALMSAGAASAACKDDDRPHVNAERRASDAVIEGNILGKEVVRESGGVFGSSATVYEVQVTRRMKGATSRRILVKPDNASPRFALEVGASYLLFLQRSGNGGYLVSSCGNSKIVDKFKNPEAEPAA